MLLLDIYIPDSKISPGTIPAPKQRPRMTRSGHTYTPKRTTNAESYIKNYIKAHIARTYNQPPYFGPVRIDCLEIWLRKPRTSKLKYPTTPHDGDIDNHLKLVCDSMNGVVFADDKYVVKIGSIEKQYCEPNQTPGYRVRVSTVDAIGQQRELQEVVDAIVA